MVKITGFILSFNQPTKVIKCVKSLFEQSCINEIILVENFSTVDMTSTYKEIHALKKRYPSVTLKIHYSKYPMSFSDGQNYISKHAKNDYILTISNDAYILQPNSLQSSLDIMLKHSNTFIVGHKILNSDLTLNHFGVIQLFYDKGQSHFGNGASPNDPLFMSPKKCVAVTAACMLFKRSSITFDTNYWFEYEDVDFCFQHYFANHDIYVNPNCITIHNEKGTRETKKQSAEWIDKQRQGQLYHHKKWKKKLFILRWICLKDNLLSKHSTRNLALSKLGDIIGVFCGLISFFIFYLFKLNIFLIVIIFLTAKYTTILAGKYFVRKKEAQL